jgi:hypothetical protein
MLDPTTPTEKLGLPVAVMGCLGETGLFPTVGDLAKAPILVLREIKGIGPKAVTAIAGALATAGYVLGNVVPVPDPDPAPADPALALAYWQKQAGQLADVLVSMLKTTPGGTWTVPAVTIAVAVERRVYLTPIAAGGYTVALTKPT